jgi:hypothetical protein
MSAVVCGLDVHKESTYATVLDRDGQVLIQRKMPNEDIPSFLAHATLATDAPLRAFKRRYNPAISPSSLRVTYPTASTMMYLIHLFPCLVILP